MDTDSNLVVARAGGREIKAADVIHYLRFSDDREVLHRCVEFYLVQMACDDAHITCTEAEVEEYAMEFRTGEGLLTEAATRKWLKQQRLSDDDFEVLMEYQLKEKKLKSLLVKENGRLDKLFIHARNGLDAVELYQIVVDEESAARELLSLLSEGAEFFGLAKSHSQDEKTRAQCGYMGILRRNDLRAEVKSVVFACQEGEIAGPVKTLGTYRIYLVERFIPAKLDDEIERELTDEYFREWLARRLTSTSSEILL